VQPVVVKVELYGIVRDLVKDRNVELQLPDRETATFRTVLEGLAQRYGPALQDRLFDRFGPSSFVKVFAEGKAVEDLDEALPIEHEPVVRIIIFAAAGGG
jgi:molybdopterin converting factor small subunit